MSESGVPRSLRFQFYGSLEASLIAWVAMMLAVNFVLGISGWGICAVTLAGMLAILGVAMRHPVYKQLKAIS
jgi:hypothetical protein